MPSKSLTQVQTVNEKLPVEINSKSDGSLSIVVDNIDLKSKEILTGKARIVYEYLKTLPEYSNLTPEDYNKNVNDIQTSGQIKYYNYTRQYSKSVIPEQNNSHQVFSEMNEEDKEAYYLTKLARNLFLYETVEGEDGTKTTNAKSLIPNHSKLTTEEINKLGDEYWNGLSGEEREEYIKKAQELDNRSKQGKYDRSYDQKMLNLQALNILGITTQTAIGSFTDKYGKTDWLKFKDFIDEYSYEYLSRSKDQGKMLSPYEEHALEVYQSSIDIAKYYGAKNPCYGDAIKHLDAYAKENKEVPILLVYDYLTSKQGSLTPFEEAKLKNLQTFGDLGNKNIRNLIKENFLKTKDNTSPLKLLKVFDDNSEALAEYARAEGKQACQILQSGYAKKYGKNTPEYFKALSIDLKDAGEHGDCKTIERIMSVLFESGEQGLDILSSQKDVLMLLANTSKIYRYKSSRHVAKITNSIVELRNSTDPNDQNIALILADNALKRENHTDEDGNINNTSAATTARAFNVNSGFNVQQEFDSSALTTALTDARLQESNIDFFSKEFTEEGNTRVIETAWQLLAENQVHAIEQRTNTGNEKYINAASEVIHKLAQENQIKAGRIVMEAAIKTGNPEIIEKAVTQINQNPAVYEVVVKDSHIQAQMESVQQKYSESIATMVARDLAAKSEIANQKAATATGASVGGFNLKVDVKGNIADTSLNSTINAKETLGKIPTLETDKEDPKKLEKAFKSDYERFIDPKTTPEDRAEMIKKMRGPERAKAISFICKTNPSLFAVLLKSIGPLNVLREVEGTIRKEIMLYLKNDNKEENQLAFAEYVLDEDTNGDYSEWAEIAKKIRKAYGKDKSSQQTTTGANNSNRNYNTDPIFRNLLKKEYDETRLLITKA
ncbi:MAG: hypothetical protein LBK53_04605 [Heliobacteriaceae bacterium]|jgi:hypothetical protein|nr:hypothetical protein [Heliobacteriaceae bacterium]